MTWVEVDQFRAKFADDGGTLTAELTCVPQRWWRQCCQPNLERYASAFGQLPVLGEHAVEVAVSPWDVAVAEAALRQVVSETNRRALSANDGGFSLLTKSARTDLHYLEE